MLLFYRVIIPTLTVPGTGVDTGAVLNIRDRDDTWKLNARGGDALERRFQKLEQVAHEQNNALHRVHYTVKSTWMLRDQANAPQPGAIRTPYDDRLAIAGFTWQQNQNAGLWLAQELIQMSFTQAHGIAALCGEGRSYTRQSTFFTAALNKPQAVAT